MDYNKAFSELTHQEFAVFYWKCQGLTHTQVGDILGWGMDNVQKYNTRAHKKLGLGELLPKRREKILDEEICPALSEWIKSHTEALDRLRPPEEPQLPPGSMPSDDEPEFVEGEPVDEEEWKKEETQPRKPVDRRQPIRRRPPWVLGCIVLGVLALIGLSYGAFRVFQLVNPSITPTTHSILGPLPGTHTPAPTRTATEIGIPTDTTPPTLTYTPEIPPTAVSLPITEHFNNSMSDVWQVTGDPILTTTDFYYGSDGVLTTLKQHFASVAIGNKAWTDYIIHFRAEPGGGEILLGFRVQDLNNMLGIECKAYNCEWVVISNGVKESISRAGDVNFQTEFTLTVEEENFNGLTNNGSGYEEGHPFLVLPPKYQGKFLNGGIYIRFTDVFIDYIEILAIR